MATLSEVFSNIANAIRNKTGKTATMTPAEMVTEIGALSDTSADTVTAATMLSGTTAHDKSGTKVTGTIATKTSSNMTVSGATVTAPAGYYASAQSKSVATAAQATPSISVDSAGKITASATQTAGYVSAGTKSATKQLTVQAAKTVTPSTSSQTAVASGVYTTGAVTVAAIPSAYVKPTATKAATTYIPTTSNQTIAAGTYCSGAQTIKGDANLVPENIASGVSIFGVEGTLEAGGVEGCTVNFAGDWTQTFASKFLNFTIVGIALTYYDDNYGYFRTDILDPAMISNGAEFIVPKWSTIIIMSDNDGGAYGASNLYAFLAIFGNIQYCEDTYGLCPSNCSIFQVMGDGALEV